MCVCAVHVRGVHVRECVTNVSVWELVKHVNLVKEKFQGLWKGDFFFTLCCLHIFSESFKKYAFGASEMTQQVKYLTPKLLLLTAVNKKTESQKLYPDISTRSILHRVIKV